ncbi:MAG: hypothetical protein OSA48_11420, partial [Akkermansiaceae bacterium]|nr:hypothetical protein [Akkermansiaceae bacterium]
RAAKSAVIRVLVPPLDLNLPPEDQVEEMKLGIAADSEFQTKLLYGESPASGQAHKLLFLFHW